MSLINDALKKAQKQRTGEAPSLASMPSVGGESARQISSRGKPASGAPVALIGGGIAAVLVIGLGAWLAFGRKAESGKLKAEDPTPPSTTVASSQASAPSTQPSVPSAAPSFTLPVAPKSEDRGQRTDVSSAPGGPVSAPAASSHVGPPLAGVPPSPAAKQPAPVSAPAAPAPKLDSRAIEFIDNIKVAGIRASATDAKVLMNDRVYRPGSMVSAEFGLKLVEIANGALTFEDEKGGRYTRTF